MNFLLERETPRFGDVCFVRVNETFIAPSFSGGTTFEFETVTHDFSRMWLDVASFSLNDKYDAMKWLFLEELEHIICVFEGLLKTNFMHCLYVNIKPPLVIFIEIMVCFFIGVIRIDFRLFLVPDLSKYAEIF